MLPLPTHILEGPKECRLTPSFVKTASENSVVIVPHFLPPPALLCILTLPNLKSLGSHAPPCQGFSKSCKAGGAVCFRAFPWDSWGVFKSVTLWVTVRVRGKCRGNTVFSLEENFLRNHSDTLVDIFPWQCSFRGKRIIALFLTWRLAH